MERFQKMEDFVAHLISNHDYPIGCDLDYVKSRLEPLGGITILDIDRKRVGEKKRCNICNSVLIIKGEYFVCKHPYCSNKGKELS